MSGDLEEGISIFFQDWMRSFSLRFGSKTGPDKTTDVDQEIQSA